MRGVHFCLALHVGLGGADGNFYGRGSGCGNFRDVGDSGGGDVGVRDARNVLVDGGRGTSGSGTGYECGREAGVGAGEEFEWADEFADEVVKEATERSFGPRNALRAREYDDDHVEVRFDWIEFCFVWNGGWIGGV